MFYNKLKILLDLVLDDAIAYLSERKVETANKKKT